MLLKINSLRSSSVKTLEEKLQNEITLGRNQEDKITDKKISRKQVIIKPENGAYYLTVLGVNPSTIKSKESEKILNKGEKCELKDKDQLYLYFSQDQADYQFNFLSSKTDSSSNEKIASRKRKIDSSSPPPPRSSSLIQDDDEEDKTDDLRDLSNKRLKESQEDNSESDNKDKKPLCRFGKKKKKL